MIFLILFTQNIVFAKADNWSQPSSTYKPQPGETWDNIAKKFDVPVTLLQRYNNSGSKHTLTKKISIPEKIIYKVKSAETAIKIAITHGMTFSELIMINGLSDPDTLKPGDNLKIFNARVKTIVNKKPSPSNSPNSIKFIWPANGKVLSKFGIQPDGSHNNDIHILLEDSKITATAPGVVVYTGNQVGSYGNLIIIQHEDNWFSSYGNLSSIQVNKGDNIKAEQVLGTINFDNSQQKKTELYFGLRIGATAVNPMKYLKRPNKKSKA